MKRLMSLGFVLVAAVASSGQSQPQSQSAATPLVVEMHDSNAKRGGSARGLLGALFGGGGEKLVKRGAVRVADESFDLYLPTGPYSLKNTGDSDTAFDNTATRVTIDADRDGQFDESEQWYVNLPIRVGDSMFEVRSIAPDGSRVELAPSAAPLAGVVLNRKAPPFEYTTSAGKKLTSADLAGKAFLLDIWSVT